MPSWTLPLVGPGLAVDLRRPYDLSVRVHFDAAQARAFSLPPPGRRPVEAGGFIGDVRRGGSCNCETYVLTPHGDGTHTEGVGHLLEERVAVVDLLDDALLPALVVTLAPRRLEEVEDEVAGNHGPDDLVIDELSLQEAIARARQQAPGQLAPRALVVRTAPGEARRQARFSGTNPPYLTADAAASVRAGGFEHLLVDLPSLDREDDGGLLGAHRAFFDLSPRASRLEGEAPRRTVTELCAVDEAVADGGYALALQLAPMEADAVPSRPLLFPLVAAAPSWKR
jgi:arylformamidase